MNESTGAFNKFVFESAEKYLHTVVLIDDRIYEGKGGSVATPLMKPQTGRRKAALKSAEFTSKRRSKAVEARKDSDEPEEVSFLDVQNSFAKKRIICSLYQPKKDASFSQSSEVYSLCSSADVVVVDWDLQGNHPGDKATELVVNLIEQSMKEVPHQLRLILIYTLEPNLGSVANDIYEGLTTRIGEQSIGVEGTEGLILTTNNSRIVVLGKRPNSSLPQYAGFFVPEKELAQRTTIEFSRLASGLLQAIVLRGIANLRENNRRILMRFHSGLDVAFLTHRALLLPDEAFGQIIPLLTDEIRAVIEDTLGECPLGPRSTAERIVANWCVTHWKPGSNPRFNIGEGADALEFAKDVLCNGPGIKNDYSKVQKSEIHGLVDKTDYKHPRWKGRKGVKIAEYLTNDSNGDYCHEMLSSLMSQRIAYENTYRALHLGVIIREVKGNQRYLLCLQPVCDSVRIKGRSRPFIFCFLDVPDAEKPFTHTVVDLSHKPTQLNYQPKISKCYVLNFTTVADSVCAAKDNHGRFIYKDDEHTEYEWIAELKTEHAQRAAEEFGNKLTRIGLTESEWLRLKAK